MTIRCVKDLAEAKLLWNQWSPNKYLNDLWDFRYCFYKYFNYELFFYLGFVEEEPIGLMPLQYNSDEEYLEFFGDVYIEDNRVFIKSGYENLIPRFYNNLDREANLEDIIGEDSFTKALPIADYKYILDLAGIENFEDYIDKFFTGKSKKNLRREMQIVEKNNIEIKLNQFEDMDLMIDMSIENFGKDSYFSHKYSGEIFHDLLKLPLKIYLLTFMISGKPEAVSLAILYKDTYVYITSSSNKKGVVNLGKYVNLVNIQKAIELGAKVFDAGLTDSNWKNRWGFTRISEYKFIRD